MIKTRHGDVWIEGGMPELIADYSSITEIILTVVLEGDEEELKRVVATAMKVAKMTDEEVSSVNEGIDQLMAALEKIANVPEGDGNDDKSFS